MTVGSEVVLRTLDGRRYRGIAKNTSASIGSIASRLAATHAGIAGTFQILDKNGIALDPNTTLANLPEAEELTLASELTPA